jgi:hypothetical protein
MPAFEPTGKIIHRVVTCARCQQQGRYRLDLGSGDFFYECECTSLEIPAIHTNPNGPSEICCVTQPSRMVGLRPSRRTLSVGPHGRLFRERWRCEAGIILQSGADFVTISSAEGRQQFWAQSFEQAFFELSGQPWQPGGDKA